MMNPNSSIVDFKIDILTEPILNRISGDMVNREISPVTKTDLKCKLYQLRIYCALVVHCLCYYCTVSAQ